MNPICSFLKGSHKKCPRCTVYQCALDAVSHQVLNDLDAYPGGADHQAGLDLSLVQPLFERHGIHGRAHLEHAGQVQAGDGRHDRGSTGADKDLIVLGCISVCKMYSPDFGF